MMPCKIRQLEERCCIDAGHIPNAEKGAARAIIRYTVIPISRVKASHLTASPVTMPDAYQEREVQRSIDNVRTS